MGYIRVKDLNEHDNPFTVPIDPAKPPVARTIITKSSGKLEPYVLDVQETARQERPFHLVLTQEGIEAPRDLSDRAFQIVRLADGTTAEQNGTELRAKISLGPATKSLDPQLLKGPLCGKCTNLNLGSSKSRNEVVLAESLRAFVYSAGLCRLCAIFLNAAKHLDGLIFDQSRAITLRTANETHHPDHISGGEALSHLILEFPTLEQGFEHLRAVRQLQLSLFVEHDSPTAVSSGVVGRRVYAGSDLLPAISWFSQCLNHHPKCAASRKGHESRTSHDGLPVPRRVLDVGANFELPKLVSFEMGNIAPYLALSYQWGEAVSVTTNSLNHIQHQTAIPLSNLCKIYQDAIAVTRRLGFRYLWIDSLCIIQDSPADLLRELPLMGDIYDNASITLAASVAASGKAGFLHDRQQWNEVELPYKKSDLSRAGKVFVTDRLLCGFEEDVTRGALSRRAWCLQERAMSRRVLHFGKDQLFWECHTGIWSEESSMRLGTRSNTTDPVSKFRDAFRNIADNVTLGPGKPRSTNVSPGPEFPRMTDRSHMRQVCKNVPYGPWYELVEQYTKRAMTCESDKLPAIAGVATKFADRINNVEYVAGLWLQDLPAGLLWSSSRFNEWSNNHLRGSASYRAPSWSWASVDGDIHYVDCFIHHWTLEVLGVQLRKPQTLLNTSLASSHALHLRGKMSPLFRLVEFRHEDERYMMQERKIYERFGPFKISHVIFDFEEDAQIWKERLSPSASRLISKHSQYMALLVGPIGCGADSCHHYANCKPGLGMALILSPTLGGCYKRVGLAQVKVESYSDVKMLTDVIIV